MFRTGAQTTLRQLAASGAVQSTARRNLSVMSVTRATSTLSSSRSSFLYNSNKIINNRFLSTAAATADGETVPAADLAVQEEIKNMSEAEWSQKWEKAVSGTRSDLHYEESAEQLRTILKSGILRLTDLHNNPERFFLAHRILARLAPKLGPGFWVRFTVQYNLFAGTILGLASPEQLKMLDDFQAQGTLGCFGLTEKLAGVNSGLVINTEAHWDFESQTFVLNTPDVGAQKNWISQGYVSDKALIFANLFIGGKRLVLIIYSFI